MTDLQQINIESLLPQRAPFILIDHLIHFDEVVTRTDFNIKAGHLFVENNFLTEAGIIENIAQTCAARMGYINTYLIADKVKLGFIGAIKNLVIRELPAAGEWLTTTIEVVNEVFALTLVQAKVVVENKLIASCEMKISLTDIDSPSTENL